MRDVIRHNECRTSTSENRVVWHVDVAVTQRETVRWKSGTFTVPVLFIDKQGDKHWSDLSTLI